MVRRKYGEVKHGFGRGFRMSMDWFVWEKYRKTMVFTIKYGVFL